MDNLIDRKKLFKTLAYLIVLIFLVNFVAVRLYWYNSIWYFDMLMHFLGGFWLGLAVIWLLAYKNLSLELSWKLVFKIILSVFFIGLFWEFYEIVVNNIFAQMPFNILDTLSDIFFDLAGGAFSVFYFFKKNHESERGGDFIKLENKV
jgi:hypothetical protein